MKIYLFGFQTLGTFCSEYVRNFEIIKISFDITKESRNQMCGNSVQNGQGNPE